MVAASRASNADDEHDPEGATIAFERQQLATLLDAARRRLADVDAALERRAAGSYGRCERCGRPITPERLAARPATRSCIDCAT
ncbi:TraR/DksA family transcriptional regulator [Geodermatophilus marinus]|uniref:TraR/DksA family transcriptional regulator n=1 Tax=Geodermatophilus sp. LHW52908 TaxID=2303986 RepID=UPI000E3CCD52|nr:TraR/DksA C4-type zinc finger protein [Geodermatophilus sp. LHW52908]RFU19835.1 TraR/DksA family transcriptional regulator [Geodermatophilus sp. LHW52908]